MLAFLVHILYNLVGWKEKGRMVRGRKKEPFHTYMKVKGKDNMFLSSDHSELSIFSFHPNLTKSHSRFVLTIETVSG